MEKIKTNSEGTFICEDFDKNSPECLECNEDAKELIERGIKRIRNG